jgi:hypothetical protein
MITSENKSKLNDCGEPGFTIDSPRSRCRLNFVSFLRFCAAEINKDNDARAELFGKARLAGLVRDHLQPPPRSIPQQG